MKPGSEIEQDVKVDIPCTLSAGGRLPVYASSGSSGADLCALLEKAVLLQPGTRALIPTGLRLQIPYGFEGQVRPRSGHANRSGITVLNAPGTIDADYRGEVKVLLINLGEAPFKISNGDRIAQLVVCPVARADFRVAGALDQSSRGSGGFGSTGT